MATVFDVARYVTEQAGPMSTWKLQKLCYYAQAWSIAWTEAPLFEEDFEAWANGPVCPTLFYAHQGKFYVDAGDFPGGNISELSDDQIDTINRVLDHYGSWEPYALREQTHAEDPWRNARGSLPEGALSNALISKESMGAYYGSF